MNIYIWRKPSNHKIKHKNKSKEEFVLPKKISLKEITKNPRNWMKENIKYFLLVYSLTSPKDVQPGLERKETSDNEKLVCISLKVVF